MCETSEGVAELLSKLDSLVLQCVSGKLTMDEFLDRYGYPIRSHRLDGLETEQEYKAVLQKFKERIELHERITTLVLHRICSEADAKLTSYQLADRIGAKEASDILQSLVSGCGWL